MLIKLTVLSSLLLQLEVSEAIPYISAAVVYFTLICCNLEGIDLMPHSTRTRFSDMDCWKASLIDAEHCSRILNEKAMKPVNAWQPTSLELLLSFTVMLLETRWLKRHDTRLASVVFLSTQSVDTVCHSRPVCACQNHHLHGDFLWIIGKEKRSEYSTLKLNIFHFLVWLNYMFHWILIAFLWTCLCDLICNFRWEWYCITLIIKESQTGQQAFRNFLLDF